MDLMPDLIPFPPASTGIKGSQSHFEGPITFQRTLTLRMPVFTPLSSSALQQKAPLRYGRFVETFTTLPCMGYSSPWLSSSALLTRVRQNPQAQAPEQMSDPTAPRRNAPFSPEPDAEILRLDKVINSWNKLLSVTKLWAH